MALAQLRQWRMEERRPDPGRLDPITLAAESPAVPGRRQLLGRRAGDAGAGHAGRAQDFNEILRVLGHARSDAFITSGAERLVDILGPGTAIYHVNLLSFAFRLPGHAEPDSPAMIDRIVDGFREPIMCDDVPIDTRIGIGLKAMGRAGGSPGEDLRATLSAAQDSRGSAQGLGLVRPHDATSAHRRAFRLLSDLKHALDVEGQLELHYQPKVDAGQRRLRQRRGAAALDASRSSGRCRPGSSSSWPRPPRWSLR